MKLQHLHTGPPWDPDHPIASLMHAALETIADEIEAHTSKYFARRIQSIGTRKVWISIYASDGNRLCFVGMNDEIWPSVAITSDYRNIVIDLKIDYILNVLDHFYYFYKSGHW